MTENGQDNQGKGGRQDRVLRGAERARAALELRKRGKTYQFIADELGYSGEGAAYKAIKTAISHITKEPAEDVRDMELARLDAALDALWDRIVKGDEYATDRMIKIMDRRAKLLGLDAPTKLSHDGLILPQLVSVDIGIGPGRAPDEKSILTNDDDDEPADDE